MSRYGGWIVWLVLSCLAAVPVRGQNNEVGLYDGYARVLARHVDEKGLVDYQALQGDRAGLDAFIIALGRVSSGTYEKWDTDHKLAFWINAYNAITLQVIIDHYPIKPTFPARLKYPPDSIRQIKGAWDKLTFSVLTRSLTLDDIEHKILRREFSKPRFHLAVVCASRGCARLRNEPYDGARLIEQLDDQGRYFFADANKFRIDREKKVVWLSPYFKWFGEDFVPRYGRTREFAGYDETERASLNFASVYLDYERKSYLAAGGYRIRFLDYDWSLNER